MQRKFCPACGRALAPATEPHRSQKCELCGAEHFRNSKPCAGALVVRGGRVLLVRRAIEPFKGHWDTPGGFLHENEHPEVGARREILEETGLHVRLVGLFGIYMDCYGGDDADEWTLNIYYIAEPMDDAEPRAADDASEIGWFAPDALPATMAFKHERQVLEDWRARLRQS
ncbi:MAG: NUDIX hydrolase [Verrucomicrobiia bacterium]